MNICVIFQNMNLILEFLASYAQTNVIYSKNDIKMSDLKECFILCLDMNNKNICNPAFKRKTERKTPEIIINPQMLPNISKNLADVAGFLKDISLLLFYINTTNYFPSNASKQINNILGNFMKMFWEKTFNCSMNDEGLVEPCESLEQLDTNELIFTEVLQLQFTYNTYMATYAIAYALHDLLSCQPFSGPFKNGSCATIDDFENWQVRF